MCCTREGVCQQGSRARPPAPLSGHISSFNCQPPGGGSWESVTGALASGRGISVTFVTPFAVGHPSLEQQPMAHVWQMCLLL